MEVTIKAYGNVRAALGEKTVRLDVPAESTVGDVLTRLGDEFDIDLVASAGRGPLVVMKNGTNVNQLDGDDTPVDAGDTLGLSGSPMPEG